jgi:hypothetical protein
MNKLKPKKQDKTFVNQCVKAINRSIRGLNVEISPARADGKYADDDALAILRASIGDEVQDLVARKMHPGKLRAVSPFEVDGKRSIFLFDYIEIGICADLHRRGISFADLAGNVHVPFNRSLIYVSGQPDRNSAMPTALLLPGLSGTLNARLVFGLLARPDMLALTQRELAQKIGIALGGVSRGIKQLASRAYVSTPQAGRKPTLLRKDQLLEVWRSEYEHRLAPRLRRRRMSGDVDALRALDLTIFGMQWGGEAAAERITSYLRPIRYQLYTDPMRPNAVAQLAAAAKLRRNDDGNIEIIDRFWDFDPIEGDRRDTVPLPLVYADLMATGDPRCQETAVMIRERFLER